MGTDVDYLSVNRNSWNERTRFHLRSEFYDVAGFLSGNSTLRQPELQLLGDLRGKKVLHLQCHFGLDTLSLARSGAIVTGVDFSERAIEAAIQLAAQASLPATFICCDLYSLPQHLSDSFDIVFTSYGVLGWLPDLKRWAEVVQYFLRPEGKLVLAEFHPVVWMFDDDFGGVAYHYQNGPAIVEEVCGTYADVDAPIITDTVTWNHGLAEVITAILNQGLQIQSFAELDYSPYNCFKHMVEHQPNEYRVAHLGNRIPMVYTLLAVRPPG
jgi:2-polyprenyl-3-methyl-5-hydroxy-6-metoxy-1,4-benzoquinol methylase